MNHSCWCLLKKEYISINIQFSFWKLKRYRHDKNSFLSYLFSLGNGTSLPRLKILGNFNLLSRRLDVAQEFYSCHDNCRLFLVITDLTPLKPSFYHGKGLIMSCWRIFASDPSDRFLMIVKVLISAGRMGQFKCLSRGLNWSRKSLDSAWEFSLESSSWPLELGDVQVFNRIAPELFLHAYHLTGNEVDEGISELMMEESETYDCTQI